MQQDIEKQKRERYDTRSAQTQTDSECQSNPNARRAGRARSTPPAATSWQTVEVAGRNRLAQGIRQEIHPGGDLSQLFPLMQISLDLYKCRWCQNCSSAPARFFVKSCDALLAIELYASLHIDCGIWSAPGSYGNIRSINQLLLLSREHALRS